MWNPWEWFKFFYETVGHKQPILSACGFAVVFAVAGLLVWWRLDSQYNSDHKTAQASSPPSPPALTGPAGAPHPGQNLPEEPKAAKTPKHEPHAPNEKTESPLFSDLRVTQRLVPSDKADLPFGQEITVQTAVSIEPVAIVIKCDGEIGDGRGGVGAGVYIKTKQGVVVDHPDWYLVEFESPAFTPQSPLVVTLFSKQRINALTVEQVQYIWP